MARRLRSIDDPPHRELVTTSVSKHDLLIEHLAYFAVLPVLDDRAPDETLGYDDVGLPS